MNVSVFFNLRRNRNGPYAKNVNLSKLLQYFARLKIGEWTGSIYNKKINSKTENKDELIASMKIIDSNIRRSLNRIRIESRLDVENKIGFENIGLGCMLISPIIFGRLMAITQGKASFYFPTKINEKYLLKISLLSIPKISGIIEFEDRPVHYFSISTLNDCNLTIPIKPDYVVNVISKISILANRHWSPKYLDKSMPNFPLGVIVRSIELLVL